MSGLDMPLGKVQKLVATQLPVGVRTVSANEREFTSRYYVGQGAQIKPAAGASERFSAEIIILGSQRPYDLVISVTSEERVENGFQVTGHDQEQAQQLYNRLHDQLTKRREDRNIIDDFRVF